MGFGLSQIVKKFGRRDRGFGGLEPTSDGEDFLLNTERNSVQYLLDTERNSVDFQV